MRAGTDSVPGGDERGSSPGAGGRQSRGRAPMKVGAGPARSRAPDPSAQWASDAPRAVENATVKSLTKDFRS